MTSPSLSLREARRLALARAGLLKPALSALPERAPGAGKRARAAAHRIIDHFGYLQLDTVSIAGARSHAIVLLSRLDGFAPDLGEALLKPGEPLFEYWGHEASWLPLGIYPLFGFRRREFRHHPWWGNVVGKHRKAADELLRRIRDDGPIRSLDMEGPGSRGWWDLKLTKRIATALWSSGELAIRERTGFQRSYDLAERVIPEHLLAVEVSEGEALERLLLKALEGHGWAVTGTLTNTWRLRNRKPRIAAALRNLVERKEIEPCDLDLGRGRRIAGWIRPADRELAARLETARPRSDRGVLLSPFDPVLWDRARVKLLFDFDQVLEIFKPGPKRVYGYYCLPVLAGERLVARLDLKARRDRGVLEVLSTRLERDAAVDREAATRALERFARALGLTATGA